MNELSRMITMRIPKTVLGMNSSSQIGTIGKEWGTTKALIVTDQGVYKAGLTRSTAESLQKEAIPVEVFDRCGESAPVSLLMECAGIIKEHQINLVIGIGGGSVLDLTKLATSVADHGNIEILFNPSLIKKKITRTILVPTTAGTGSEVGNGALCTNDETHRKIIVKNEFIAADVAVLDPMLTMNLPPSITAETGMDALSHAIEAYTSAKANAVADVFAEKSIKLVAQNIRLAYTHGPQSPEARYNMLWAASLGILGAASSSTYIVHTLSYPLGMMAHLSHGKACVLMLPYAMEFNLPGNLERFARIAELMGEKVAGLTIENRAAKSIQAVQNLIAELSLPQRLSEIGLKQRDIPAIVDYVYQYYDYQLENNPRHIEREDLQRILEAAL